MPPRLYVSPFSATHLTFAKNSQKSFSVAPPSSRSDYMGLAPFVFCQGTVPRAPLRRRFIPARHARRSAQPPSHLRASHRPAIPRDRALESGPSGRGVYTGEDFADFC
uniref:Uncharacterized protein n=1 Tax=Fagus sylvatica TaxID=28930 RepID=A0A2N9G4N6_FAGSY